MMPEPKRPANVAEAEYWIIAYLMTGENANLKNISSIASKLHAGLDAEGNVHDSVAHNRFNKAISNIEGMLMRQFVQRCNKLVSGEHTLEELMLVLED